MCQGDPMTQHIVALVAAIDSGESMQSKQRERHGGWSLGEEAKQKLPNVPPNGVAQDVLNSPAVSCDSPWEVLSTRHAH